MDSKTAMELARRIAKHNPRVHLTTEQLMDAAIQTVKQMSPEEKAKLRQELDQKVDRKLLAKTADRLLRVSSDVLLGMKCDPRVN